MMSDDQTSSPEARIRALEARVQELEAALASRSPPSSETLYRSIAQNLPGGSVYVVDHDLRYLVADGPMMEEYGWTPQKIEGRTVGELFSGEPGAEIERCYRAALAGESLARETVHPQGVSMTRYAPLRDASGHIIGALALALDITERRRAEDALRRSETMLARAQRVANIGSWERDLITGETIASAEMFGIVGLSPEKGAPSFEVVVSLTHPDDRAAVQEAMQRARTEGRPVRLEYRVLRPDGQLRYLSTHADVEVDAAGKPVRMVGIGMDITERKVAEAARLESELQFRTLANSLPQLAWMTDGDGSIFWYNQRWYDYTGTTFEEMKGWGWEKVHHPDHVDRVRELFKAHLVSGEPWEDTFPLRSRSGEWRWFLSRALPIRDETGRIVRWFGSNTDITEQRAVQQELEESVRARDEFLSIASHELRTPLTSLKLQSQMFLRATKPGTVTALQVEPVRRLAEQMDKQTSRLNRLVEDMLDIARIRTGRLQLAPAPTSLNALVDEVVERLRPSMLAAGVTPQVLRSEAIVGTWDHFRLEQVLTNLLTNAMRYGGHQPVEIRLERAGLFARLSLEDHGLGLRPEDHERIFNRFERAVSADEISGLGLGLYISRQIVEAHRGRLWVESAGEGRGATFFVELPLE
jgi:PAS domain S-box-containing protein